MAEKKKMNYRQLAQVLEQVISRPPARAGLQLLPEYELASRLGLSRMKVRRALDILFEKGYLSRSRGCGTFIRKVAADSSSTLQPGFSDIFESTCQHESGRRADHNQQSLNLSFWHDFSFYDTNISILEGMKAAAANRGHSFTDISAMAGEGVLLDAASLREMIEEREYDGYLVSLRCAQRFKEALDGREVNCVYVGPGTYRIAHEPLVQMNLVETVERSMRELYAGGYRRIAMLYLQHPKNEPGVFTQPMAYELTARELGLDYHCLKRVSIARSEVIQAVQEIFDESEPDAFYIGDEHILPAFIKEINKRNLKPGRDIGVITQHSAARELPHGIDFSRMEFDLSEFGAVAVDTLVQSIMTAGRRVSNMSLYARWRPGQTHLK